MDCCGKHSAQNPENGQPESAGKINWYLVVGALIIMALLVFGYLL